MYLTPLDNDKLSEIITQSNLHFVVFSKILKQRFSELSHPNANVNTKHKQYFFSFKLPFSSKFVFMPNQSKLKSVCSSILSLVVAILMKNVHCSKVFFCGLLVVEHEVLQLNRIGIIVNATKYWLVRICYYFRIIPFMFRTLVKFN